LIERLGFVQAFLKENSKLSLFILGIISGVALQLFLNYFI